ncbi:hypothetical protein A3A21_01110 [Candidatus Jorgensenbacteria bacterium RIFCSPLOWO2_01_FULL_45_25b]|uniref:Uncharacterized protein n=1 Tax=Candidatus Jorgensenbacteria bacterium RIFCSPLOWO2_01_FULL_45_25b TaxID=1798471 RepID=A0A1F6BVL3_9BACT|nr:MAG: hypothetical protein A3A21_01110 [Candidatus Jorgensenbacteria bacterium RIFCSPLOWO2_01_FULL_45_25b]
MKKTKTFLAIGLSVSLAVWTVMFGFQAQKAEGATLKTISDTLSDSDLGVGANHTVRLTTPTGIAAGLTITYNLPSVTTTTGFASSSVIALGLLDFDFMIGTTEQTVTTPGGCSGATTVGIATSTTAATSTITVTICTSNSVSAGVSTTLRIGTNAVTGGTGTHQITNPSTAGSYEITIAGTQTDSGSLQVAIIDDVTVTASVNTSFTFTISGVNSGTSCAGVTASATSLSTSTPFGTLSTTVSSTLCQTLAVTTNAKNGFTVTVQADQTLTSASGADIDLFVDGNATSVPSTWVAPAGTLDSEATYGHWGISTEDSNLSTDTSSSSDAFVSGSNYKYVGDFVAHARSIFAHTGPADGSTADKGTTKVAISVQIGALQEAANDYTATITYVATPVF